jgi:hypothetical protein
VVEQLKALPATEWDAFSRLFRSLEAAAVPAEGNGKSVSVSGNWSDFGARLKRIYGDKITAESEAVISYARGEW